MREWRDNALCTPRLAYLFDAPKGAVKDDDRDRYRLARQLCATCPVLEMCAADTTVQQSDGFRHGVLFTRNYNHSRNVKPRPTPWDVKPKRRPVKPRETYLDRDIKRCPACGETKSINEYRRDATRADGRRSYCKPCSTARQQAERHRRRAA